MLSLKARYLCEIEVMVFLSKQAYPAALRKEDTDSCYSVLKEPGFWEQKRKKTETCGSEFWMKWLTARHPHHTVPTVPGGWYATVPNNEAHKEQTAWAQEHRTDPRCHSLVPGTSCLPSYRLASHEVMTRSAQVTNNSQCKERRQDVEPHFVRSIDDVNNPSVYPSTLLLTSDEFLCNKNPKMT